MSAILDGTDLAGCCKVRCASSKRLRHPGVAELDACDTSVYQQPPPYGFPSRAFVSIVTAGVALVVVLVWLWKTLPVPDTEEPSGPVLLGHGGGGGGGESDVAMNHPLWLWPLPPPETFDLVVEWPALGIALTRVQVDGAALRDASRRVEPMFDRD